MNLWIKVLSTGSLPCAVIWFHSYVKKDTLHKMYCSENNQKQEMTRTRVNRTQGSSPNLFSTSLTEQ